MVESISPERLSVLVLGMDGSSDSSGSSVSLGAAVGAAVGSWLSPGVGLGGAVATDSVAGVLVPSALSSASELPPVSHAERPAIIRRTITSVINTFNLCLLIKFNPLLDSLLILYTALWQKST